MFPVAAILGQPVAHSRSPQIHGAWLKRHHLSGAYLRREVAPETLGDVLRNFQSLGLVGANLTLPLKEIAVPHVIADDTAAKLQTVNTVWLDGGRLHGTSSDGDGFIGSLDEQASGWRSYLENIVILGSGGAAKAIIHALLKAGAERVTLINRNAGRAEVLVKLFGPRTLTAAWEDINTALLTADLLVNTTSLGMMGQPPLALDVKKLPPTAIVADIVYVPLETPLLRNARSAGLKTVDGLGMLLHQAVPGFTRWFGIQPQVDAELRAAIAAGLEGQ